MENLKQQPLKTLKNRVLGEPYDFYKVDGQISPAIFDAGEPDAAIILEAQRQFRNQNKYTVQSICQALNLPPAAYEEQVSASMQDADTDIEFAFSLYFQAHCRWIELYISQGIAGLVMQGKTAEEIQAYAQKERELRGAIAQQIGDDGKVTFERELLSALDGVIIEYPIKPHLAKMRKVIPDYQPGDYIVVAALTGIGKSYEALGTAYYNALQGHPILIINLENTPKNVYKRLWQMAAGHLFRRNLKDLNTDEAVHAWETVKALPIHCVNPGATLPAVMSTIRQYHYQHGIQFAAVDYVQLMNVPGIRTTRNYELDEISRQLRLIGLELGIPVMALAQVKQEVAHSATKRGGPYGIKDCAGFAQGATVMVELYRPKLLGVNCDPDGNDYASDYADITAYKHREGGLVCFTCKFSPIHGFHEPPLAPCSEPGEEFLPF